MKNAKEQVYDLHWKTHFIFHQSNPVQTTFQTLSSDRFYHLISCSNRFQQIATPTGISPKKNKKRITEESARSKERHFLLPKHESAKQTPKIPTLVGSNQSVRPKIHTSFTHSRAPKGNANDQNQHDSSQPDRATPQRHRSYQDCRRHSIR